MDEFSLDTTADDKPMPCPSCGNDNGLHLDATVVEAWEKEDHPTAVLVIESNGTSHLAELGESPKSGGRRHAVGLLGWCELCGVRFVLWFRQHKGQTLGSYMSLSDNSPLASYLDT